MTQFSGVYPPSLGHRELLKLAALSMMKYMDIQYTTLSQYELYQL